MLTYFPHEMNSKLLKFSNTLLVYLTAATVLLALRTF